MHFPVTALQLFDRAHAWKNQSVLGTIAGAFTVNGLRTRNDDFFNRQISLPDQFEHLRGTERIHMHKFCNFWHVTSVRSLTKDDVDSVERGGDGVAIAQIAFNEFRLVGDPRRLAALVRVRFQVIEHAHFPAFADEQVDHVRADQARATGNKCAFHFVVEAFVSNALPFRFGAWRKRRYNKFYLVADQMRIRVSLAISSLRNFRVCGAMPAVAVSVSSSSRNRRKLALSSTSYPGCSSLTSA